MAVSRILGFVTCANNAKVLTQRLLASPCLAHGVYSLAIHTGATSVGAAFNAEMKQFPQTEWLVWVHQDVFLPAGWDQRFIAALRDAQSLFPQLAVVGVYGVAGANSQMRRAGHVLDRGLLLREPTLLPCLVDSLDELLFAVRCDTHLMLDPDLGFDFYGTDIALTAQALGLNVAVVDAFCEHWAGMPRIGIAQPILDRIRASGQLFEKKWAHRLPLGTPCFSINQVGDVAQQCHAFAQHQRHGI